MAGIVALALAVVMAVLDLTRSVASSSLVATSLDSSWTAISSASRSAAEASIRGAAGGVAWDSLALVLALPGWAIFGGLAAILLWLGRKRRSAYARFARE